VASERIRTAPPEPGHTAIEAFVLIKVLDEGGNVSWGVSDYEPTEPRRTDGAGGRAPGRNFETNGTTQNEASSDCAPSASAGWWRTVVIGHRHPVLRSSENLATGGLIVSHHLEVEKLGWAV
jgi:hypothetical protein